MSADSPVIPIVDAFDSVNPADALDALETQALPKILNSSHLSLDTSTGQKSAITSPLSPFPAVEAAPLPAIAQPTEVPLPPDTFEFVQHLLDQTKLPEGKKEEQANHAPSTNGENGKVESAPSTSSSDDTFSPGRRQMDALLSLVLFLERSNGAFRHVIIPHLLNWVQVLPKMRASDVWLDYIPLDEFSYLLTMRLLRLGESFQDSAPSIWKTVTDTYFVVVEDLSEKSPDRVRSCTLPIWAGITRAMTEAPCSNHMEIIEPLLRIARTTVTDASVRAVRRAFASGTPSVAEQFRWGTGPIVLDRREGDPVWMHQRSQTSYVLGAFTMIRNIITGLSKGSSYGFSEATGPADYDLWQLILPSVVMRSPLRSCGDTRKETIRELYEIALRWAVELRQQIKSAVTPTDVAVPTPQSLDTKCVALSVVLQVAVVCILLANEVSEELLTRLNQFLNDDVFLATPNGLLVYTTCMEGLGVMASAFPKTTKAVIDLFREYLTSPSPVLCKAALGARNVIRNCAVRTVSRTLICIGNKEFTKATLYSFLHLLYSIDTSNPSGEFQGNQRIVYEDVLSAITDIACLSGSKDVVEIATSALIRRIDPTTSNPDLFVFDRLADIFVSTDSVEVASSITTLLSQLGKRSDVGSSASVELVLKRLTLHLKRGDRPPAIHRMITRQVIQMFVDKAMWARFGVDDQLNKPEQERDLLRLVHVICGMLDSATYDPAEFDQTTETIYLFRNFWIYCVIIGLDSKANWKDGWRLPLIDIARKTPAIVLKETTVPLETDLDSNSPLRQKMSDAYVHKARSAFGICVPARAGDQKSLPSKIITYLLTVYQLESLRCVKGSIKHLLRYLSSVGTFTDQVWPFLESTVYRVLEGYIYVRQAASSMQIEILERDLIPFVIAAGNRIPRCRLAARTCVEKVVTAFPFMLWNRALMTTLLHILFSLAGDFPVNPNDQNSQDPTLADLQKYLSIPDRRDHTQELINAYMDFGQRWLALSMKASASETTGVLQNYILRLQLLESRDVALIAPSTTSKVLRLLGPDVFSAVWSYGMFPEQLRYLGEVLAQIPSLADPVHAKDTDDSWIKMAEELKADFKALTPPSGTMSQRDENRFAAALTSLLQRSVGFFSISKKFDKELLRYMCWTPMKVFTEKIMGPSTSCWSLLVTARPDLEAHVIAELAEAWEWTRQVGLGIFSGTTPVDPMTKKMTFVPSKKMGGEDAMEFTIPHLLWVEFFLDRYEVARFRRSDHTKLYQKIAQTTLDDTTKLSTVKGCRTVLFKLLALVARFFSELPFQRGATRWALLMYLYGGFVPWFSQAPLWAGTSDAKRAKGELEAMLQFYNAIKSLSVAHPINIDSNPINLTLQTDYSNPISQEVLDKRIYKFAAWKPDDKKYRIPPESALDLLQILTENEIQHIWVWMNPLAETMHTDLQIPTEHVIAPNKWKDVIETAWAIKPALALQLLQRFPRDVSRSTLASFVSMNPAACLQVPSALWILAQDKRNLEKYSLHMRFIMLWYPASPMSAISIATSISPPNPWLTQYFMRTLEHYHPEEVFFYVPQLVQALRHDAVGYVERYIVETAQSSQLFAHQIIWNMNANMYKDDDAKVPDALKPTLDRCVSAIIKSFSVADREFYEREFNFFNAVTGISGKLKPFVRKTKAEKKKKIDEELRTIKVDPGVYLPSNPDSIVVDIDYDSGRPLQSHAKAPFLATFKTKNRVNSTKSVEDSATSWQSAIFKVGDDCRQDILALQLLALFKQIYESADLDVYLFPYRIIATAPGCGVIDVIPNSISRDQMGREKVNSLYDYYLAKFGSTDSLVFQKARSNFIRSLAASSIALYLLQIKDRHNGNIMFDNEGHILHIDFGYILDISPGGNINFESSPFKLTTEMIMVMGGDASTESYKWFSELTVRAFLAVRPYAEEIMQLVALMLDSGLPCFRGQTIERMRTRFQLDLSDRNAAHYAVERIKESHQNTRTILYDEFQRIQNEIPYHR